MSALQMAVLFQVVLFAIHAVRSHWGETGLLFSGAVLGFTDVDALTISMAKSAEGQIPIPVAAEGDCHRHTVEHNSEAAPRGCRWKGQISKTHASLAGHHGRRLGCFHRRNALMPSGGGPTIPLRLMEEAS